MSLYALLEDETPEDVQRMNTQTSDRHEEYLMLLFLFVSVQYLLIHTRYQPHVQVLIFRL